jgi:hypothetical protein
MLPAADWSLDYESSTAAELRQLIYDRLSATLSAKEKRTIRNCNRYHLINRLRKLDHEGSFPRFMELPPELRVIVYEYLLVDTRKEDAAGWFYHMGYGSSALCPAVLRTSKQIYSEAQSILYKQNKYSVRTTYHMSRERQSRMRQIAGCTLTVSRPGRGYPFHHQIMSSGLLLRDLFTNRAMGMLRTLTHLTINLDLVAPRELGGRGYATQAGNAITNLCLSLAGDSKIEVLTINVNPSDPERSNVDLARVLWPLIFLRTEIAIKFEGIATVPKTVPPQSRMSREAQEIFGSRVAKVRQLCNEVFQKRDRDIGDMHRVDNALHHLILIPFGVDLIGFGDIVNPCAVWRRIRSQADLVEAMRLAQ